MSEIKREVVTVLDAVQYNRLERSMPAPIVGPATTELQAGFALGVQHVLKVLRDGYVSGR